MSHMNNSHASHKKTILQKIASPIESSLNKLMAFSIILTTEYQQQQELSPKESTTKNIAKIILFHTFHPSVSKNTEKPTKTPL